MYISYLYIYIHIIYIYIIYMSYIYISYIYISYIYISYIFHVYVMYISYIYIYILYIHIFLHWKHVNCKSEGPGLGSLHQAGRIWGRSWRILVVPGREKNDISGKTWPSEILGNPWMENSMIFMGTSSKQMGTPASPCWHRMVPFGWKLHEIPSVPTTREFPLFIHSR